MDPVQSRSLLKAFNCPKCGASLNIRAEGQSLVVGCASCGSVVDVTDENYRIISSFEKNTRIIRPAIPIGVRGKLKGDIYEVIGFMQRCDGTGIYHWQEYLLFNPYKGFKWLTESQGHWNFVSMTKNRPELSVQGRVKFLSEWYELYEKGKAKVEYVIGEFYWKVKVGDTCEVEDYVRPPHMLSMEKEDGEVTWSIADYIEPDVIKDGFKVSALPDRVGVAPDQPSTAGTLLSSIGDLTAYFILSLIFIQGITIFSSKNEQVFYDSFHHDASAPDKLLKTRTFAIGGRTANVSISTYAPVANNWVELDLNLVDATTGAEVPFKQSVEYYYGYEGGESWSEGAQTKESVISSVPAGTYYLTLESSAGQNGQEYRVTVVRDVVVWSNFFAALVALLIVPLFALWRRRSFEVSRWSNSDFSPYESSSSDDN